MDLAEKFRAETVRLAGETPTADRRLGLAVSGGPDSLAMFLLADEVFPGAIAAATVDHRLRDESAEEARHVAAICRDLDVSHSILVPDRPIEGNLQSQARDARYALLEQWREQQRLGWIATAHHADDQLETMLMRLLRGAGVDGLAAIRPVNGHVIRPLLGTRKAELASLLGKRGVEAVSDPSNDDPAFDRTRIRRTLAALPDFDPARLARSAAAMRAASAALDWVAQREAGIAIECRGEATVLHIGEFPPELLRRLVLLALRIVDPNIAPRGDALGNFMAALKAGEKASLGGILGVPEAGESGDKWRFAPAPPRKTG